MKVTKVVVSEFAGLGINLYRGARGRLVVDIDTTDLEEADTWGEDHDLIPKIEIMLNEQRITVNQDGSLSESQGGEGDEL